MNDREVQTALLALGCQLPKFCADGSFGAGARAATKLFRQAHGLAVTASASEATISALAAWPARSTVVPPDWVPAAQLRRIIVHWTAGGHDASDLDRARNLLIEGGGKLVRWAIHRRERSR